MAFIDRSLASLVAVDAMSGEIEFSIRLAIEDAPFEVSAIPTFGGPAWSPDGSRLAFNCWDGAGDEVCVVDEDGTAVRQVTRIEPPPENDDRQSDRFIAAAANTGPVSWSPNGRFLAVGAYPERRGAAAGVFIVDLERGTARRVSSLIPNSEISWFPDGKSLLFSASEKGHSDVRRIGLDGAATENLSMELGSGARDPVLTLDGTRVAAASGGAIVILDLEGRIEATQSFHLWARTPNWSPSGDSIAFAAEFNSLASYN